MARDLKDYLKDVAVPLTVGVFTALVGTGFYKASFEQLKTTSAEHGAAIARIDAEGSTRARILAESDQRRLDALERTMSEVTRQLAERTATEQALLREMTALRQELRLRRE